MFFDVQGIGYPLDHNPGGRCPTVTQHEGTCHRHVDFEGLWGALSLHLRGMDVEAGADYALAGAAKLPLAA